MTDPVDEMILNNAVRLADDHRKHCTADCNISLAYLLVLLVRANIAVPQELRSRFF
jgi:hypothetical protein